jgi:hypothetical protein
MLLSGTINICNEDLKENGFRYVLVKSFTALVTPFQPSHRICFLLKPVSPTISCLIFDRLPYGNLKELMDPNIARRKSNNNPVFQNSHDNMIASPMTQMLDQIEKANSSYAKRGFP